MNPFYLNNAPRQVEVGKPFKVVLGTSKKTEGLLVYRQTYFLDDDMTLRSFPMEGIEKVSQDHMGRFFFGGLKFTSDRVAAEGNVCRMVFELTDGEHNVVESVTVPIKVITAIDKTTQGATVPVKSIGVANMRIPRQPRQMRGHGWRNGKAGFAQQQCSVEA